MNTPRRIDIEVGSKPYNISTTSIPYFASYTDFQRQPGQASEKHDDIPLFKIAYQCIKNDFRFCFQKLSTDLTEYHTLCYTLDLLCINTLKGRFIEATSEDLKSAKGYYETDYRRPIYVKANKATARDNSFRLLYFILTAERNSFMVET